VSQAQCCAAWSDAADNDRAAALDARFPNCTCEPFSLRECGGPPVLDGERIARVLTAPDGFEPSTGTILTAKLQHIHSHGLSVIRGGAADSEILDTVERLTTSGAEQRTLVGAVVVHASVIRDFADSQRWFGVYATDEAKLEHHADILATTPRVDGTRARARVAKERRYTLQQRLQENIIYAAESNELLDLLRAAGI
jgi:hypothetical protein